MDREPREMTGICLRDGEKKERENRRRREGSPLNKSGTDSGEGRHASWLLSAFLRHQSPWISEISMHSFSLDHSLVSLDNSLLIKKRNHEGDDLQAGGVNVTLQSA